MADTDKHWQRAWRYITANQTAPARAVLESILHRAPDDTRARTFLAAVCATDDRPQAAAAEARRAGASRCSDAGVLLRLARVATRVGEIGVARLALQDPVLAGAGDPDILVGAAEACQMLADHRQALAYLERAVHAGAGGVRLHFYRGIQFGALGDLAGAEREFHACVAGGAPSGHAFLQLARLHTQTPAHNHVAAIRRAIGKVAPGSDDCIGLQFALYKELEDLRRYPEAWAALAIGNRMAHARSLYVAGSEAALLARLRAICTSRFLATAAPAAGDGPQPIFVIGLPRSGTTLLERIVGNHPQVESAGELPAFLRAWSFAIDHFVEVAVPDAVALDRLDRVDWAALSRRYLEQSQWRAHGKPFYIDKLPRNWMVAGLVHKAFPRAPILHLVRDPMDVCFSNWRAYLGVGADYAYAYDLDALAAHHQQYRQLLRHWHQSMPGAILDVDYARLVHAPETVIREVFAFCGLAYAPGCADVSRNPAPSSTLSMAQVREPIHARAFREWEPYAAHLTGLQSALADIAEERSQ